MKKVAICTALTALMMTGCANHVKQDVTTHTRIDREAISNSISITPMYGTVSEHGTVESPTLVLQLNEVTQDRVSNRATTRVVDFATPYSPARELYEIPVGVVAIAGGLVINVLDFVLLGLLPNSMTDAPLAFGFAGINPFMNVESTSRMRETVVSEETELMDEKVELTTLPLAGQVVSFSSSGGHEVAAATGEDGIARVFIGPLLAAGTPNVTMSLEGRPETASYLVPRRMSQSAAGARAIYDHYRSGAELTSKERFEEDMGLLEEAGYHSFAREIEIEASLQPAFLTGAELPE